MNKLVNSQLSKVLVLAVALVIFGVGVFSMAAMVHTGNNGNCMTAMDHTAGCAVPIQSETCLDFHLGLLKNFSINPTSHFGFELLFVILALGLALFTSSSLSAAITNFANIHKVRFQRFMENTATVFQDTLGFWLSIFEKRDPSYAFAIA